MNSLYSVFIMPETTHHFEDMNQKGLNGESEVKKTIVKTENLCKILPSQLIENYFEIITEECKAKNIPIDIQKMKEINETSMKRIDENKNSQNKKGVFNSNQKIAKLKHILNLEKPFYTKDEKEHPYLENCFTQNFEKLECLVSDFEDISNNYPHPYSGYPNFFGKDKSNISILPIINNINEWEGIQVIHYTKNSSKIYLKRSYYYFNSGNNINNKNKDIDNPSQLKELKKVYKFISRLYTEYIVGKKIQIYNIGPQMISFNVIYLTNQNILVSEILMENGGESIYTLFEEEIINSLDNIEEIIFVLFKQLVNALSILEKERIVHADIKPQNIVYEGKLEDPLSLIFKIINFDITKYISTTSLTEEEYYAKGLSEIYLSPELYKQNKENLNYMSKNNIDGWKSSIYSLGVVIMYALGFFKNFTFNDYKEFDKDKMSANLYEKRKKEIDCFLDSMIKSGNKATYCNSVAFVKICLEYDPKNRPSANEIFIILNTTDFQTIKKNYELILESFITLKNKKIPTRKQLIEENKKIKEMNEKLSKRIEDTQNILTHTNSKRVLKKQNSECSFLDNARFISPNIIINDLKEKGDNLQIEGMARKNIANDIGHLPSLINEKNSKSLENEKSLFNDNLGTCDNKKDIQFVDKLQGLMGSIQNNIKYENQETFQLNNESIVQSEFMNQPLKIMDKNLSNSFKSIYQNSSNILLNENIEYNKMSYNNLCLNSHLQIDLLKNEELNFQIKSRDKLISNCQHDEIFNQHFKNDSSKNNNDNITSINNSLVKEPLDNKINQKDNPLYNPNNDNISFLSKHNLQQLNIYNPKNNETKEYMINDENLINQNNNSSSRLLNDSKLLSNSIKNLNLFPQIFENLDYSKTIIHNDQSIHPQSFIKESKSRSCNIIKGDNMILNLIGRNKIEKKLNFNKYQKNEIKNLDSFSLIPRCNNFKSKLNSLTFHSFPSQINKNSFNPFTKDNQITQSLTPILVNLKNAKKIYVDVRKKLSIDKLNCLSISTRSKMITRNLEYLNHQNEVNIYPSNLINNSFKIVNKNKIFFNKISDGKNTQEFKLTEPLQGESVSSMNNPIVKSFNHICHLNNFEICKHEKDNLKFNKKILIGFSSKKRNVLCNLNIYSIPLTIDTKHKNSCIIKKYEFSEMYNTLIQDYQSQGNESDRKIEGNKRMLSSFLQVNCKKKELFIQNEKGLEDPSFSGYTKGLFNSKSFLDKFPDDVDTENEVINNLDIKCEK